MLELKEYVMYVYLEDTWSISCKRIMFDKSSNILPVVVLISCTPCKFEH